MQCSTPPQDVSEPHPAEAHAPDLAALRSSLLRYARARLHNVTLAEDAVSETLLAAWQAQAAFPTQAQANAWVYGILRHKLVDQLRHRSREAPAGDHLPEPSTHSTDWFVGGAWCGVSSVQADPEQACSQGQFLALVLRCCDQLPPGQRQAFLLREVADDEPASICRQLGVSEGNLWVMIHRARVQLRRLLREHWLQSCEASRHGKSKRTQPSPPGHRPARAERREPDQVPPMLRLGAAGQTRTPRPSRAPPAS